MNTLTTTQKTHALLSKMVPQFKAALQRAIPPEKFVRVAMTACQKNPAILECSQETFLGALMESAQMGLEPDGRHAALIPYQQDCTFQPMVRGLVRLMHNHPKVQDVYAEVVRDKDDFRFMLGTDRKIEHFPHFPSREAGDLKYAYAVAHLEGGGRQIVILDRDEVMGIKSKSRARGGPWNDPVFEPEMWKKTALKRLAKVMPESSQLSRAVELDDAAEIGTQAGMLERVEVDATELATDEEVDNLVAMVKVCESVAQVEQQTSLFNALTTDAGQKQRFSEAAQSKRRELGDG